MRAKAKLTKVNVSGSVTLVQALVFSFPRPPSVHAYSIRFQPLSAPIPNQNHHQKQMIRTFPFRQQNAHNAVSFRGIAGVGKLAPSSDVQLCVCAAPGNRKASLSRSSSAPPCMISGTVDGGLCLWRGRNCCNAVGDAHGGAVETLSVGDARGGVVASGGRDAKVLVVSLMPFTPEYLTV